MHLSHLAKLVSSSARPALGPLVTPEAVLRREAAAHGYDDPGAVHALETMAGYVLERLARPDAALGRGGAVCPYIVGAGRRQSLLMTVSALDGSDPEPFADIMESLRTIFRHGWDPETPLADRIYQAIVVLFPNAGPAVGRDVIEPVQKRLKPAFVQDGLMIGEFYPGCPAGGLHSAAFRPFDAPVPSLAIRHMTIYDGPFMLGDALLEDSFLRQFGDEGAARLQRLRDGNGACGGAGAA